MLKKPRILVASQSGLYSEEDKDRAFDGAGRPYTASVLRAGGLPLILPMDVRASDIAEALSIVDGVLLCGGADVDPALYGAERREKCGPSTAERDGTEIEIVKQCVTRNLPILGVCRGLQVMNVALGGTLFQDIPDELPSPVVHRSQGEQRWTLLPHCVEVAAHSTLHKITKRSTLSVNSLHHQGIKKLAPGLVASAKAEDSLIEGIEMPNHRFFVGVQWHPEALSECDPLRPDTPGLLDSIRESRLIFAAFVESTTKGA